MRASFVIRILIFYKANHLVRRPFWSHSQFSSVGSLLIMGPKPNPNPTRSVDTESGATGEAPWRSTRSSRGTGGALRQLEYIQSHQTAPRIPQNEEARRIQGRLGQQPKNLFAPSNKSRKAAKESGVRGTLYILDHKFTNSLKSLDAIPAPPSPVLPRKQVVSTKDLYGFCDNRDFSQPPFTQ